MPFRSAASSPGSNLDATLEVDLERRLVAVHDRSRPRVSVVIPARNEAANLPHVLSALPPEVYEVVLVDGRSSDDTVSVAREHRPDIRVVQQTRRGKGNALACGFAAVRGDIIVMLDADGSADPSEIARYVDALLEGADFAKGTRFATGGGSSDLTWLRTWGNKGLNLVVNVLYGTRYTDLCYGYNAFWTRCLPVLALDAGESQEDRKLWGDGFEVETIINTRIARGGLKVVEVPSFELERIHGVSNLNTWRDGFRVLRAALTERVRPRHRREASLLVLDLTALEAAEAEAATA
ncbi:MAG: glycosyl transferase family 2 [Frankiales bacterium]|nr:glycosyl transferase family 2 [Frankiales bacterium]